MASATWLTISGGVRIAARIRIAVITYGLLRFSDSVEIAPKRTASSTAIGAWNMTPKASISQPARFRKFASPRIG